MTRTKSGRAEPPRAIALPALTPFADASIESHGDYEAIEFVDLDFASLDLGRRPAEAVSFLRCRLERCGLDGVRMPRVRISECLLADVHAVSLVVSNSTWRDSLVRGARIGALTAAGATWTGVRVRGGKFDFVDLSGARLTDVVFDGCAIGSLDLGDAQVRAVRFDGATVDELTVTGARLSGVDLSGAILGAVRGVESLRGASVSPDQLIDLAPSFAAHLGIEVRAD